jgi:hypothetical protein
MQTTASLHARFVLVPLQVNFARAVDFGAPSCMMMRRELFMKERDGITSSLAWGSLGLGMHMYSRNISVVCQPAAVVSNLCLM